MTDCIFCKIIAKEIPATIIYEDDDTLAFMDIGPIIKGHALVISKNHYNTIAETPAEILVHLHRVAKRVSQAQMNGLGADGVNIIQNNGTAAGQEVPHIHIHVIPRFNEDGHHWNWNVKKYENFDELTGLAEKLRNNL